MQQAVAYIVGVTAREHATGSWLGHCVRCRANGKVWTAVQALPDGGVLSGWHATVAREARRLASLARERGLELTVVVNSFKAARVLKEEGLSVRSPLPEEAEIVMALFREAQATFQIPEGATVEWHPREF